MRDAGTYGDPELEAQLRAAVDELSNRERYQSWRHVTGSVATSRAVLWPPRRTRRAYQRGPGRP